MFSEINTKLIEIQGEIRKKDKYRGQLQDYKQELVTIKKMITQLREQLKFEEKDVQKLEHISLTNLFATLSGKKDEKLAKEKQEMIAAQHKLEEAEKTKKEIDAAMLDLQNMLANLEDAEGDYQQLLLQKEHMIKTSTSPFAAKVFELSEQEGVLKAYINELDEACAAGSRVERALSNAIDALEEAANWGTWDIFGGGGTITDLVKHQHIDEAEDYLHQAQTSMRLFQKELLDVQETELFEINISRMLKFADFFFDGFIADFMVQGKINQSLEQTQDHYAQVNKILSKLTEQINEKKRELVAVQNEKKRIVEQL